MELTIDPLGPYTVLVSHMVSVRPFGIKKIAPKFARLVSGFY